MISYGPSREPGVSAKRGNYIGPGEFLRRGRNKSVRVPIPASASGPPLQMSIVSMRRAYPRSVFTSEQLTGVSAGYARSEDHAHERKPSPQRHTPASTSGEEARQAARADCRRTSRRTGCARSKGAADVFKLPPESETASQRWCSQSVVAPGFSRTCSPRRLLSRERPLAPVRPLSDRHRLRAL